MEEGFDSEVKLAGEAMRKMPSSDVSVTMHYARYQKSATKNSEWIVIHPDENNNLVQVLLACEGCKKIENIVGR